MSALRILAWNIRQGGGTRLAAIIAALARHEADVAAISEYRGGDSAYRLREALTASGYPHHTGLVPPIGKNGVLIAARRRLRAHAVVSSAVPEPYRMVRVEVAGLLLCGIYMPNLLQKVPYWRWRSAISTPAVPMSTSPVRSMRPRILSTKSRRSGSAICGAGVIPKAASFPGTAPAATGSVSTMPFCRVIWRRVPARYVIHMTSAWPASPTTRP
jgi:hypothetical protein